jgi:hypothetical protein
LVACLILRPAIIDLLVVFEAVIYGPAFRWLSVKI